MHQRHIISILVTSLLALGAAVGVTVLLGTSHVTHADPAILCVAPGGTGCSGPCGACYSSVQAAVDAADTDDEIRVAEGTYTGVQTRSFKTQMVYISKTVTLRGGYGPGNWTTADPESHPTILDAGSQGRVLYIPGGVSPTVEGLIVTRGSANAGGGIYVHDGAPILSSNVVTNNHSTSVGGGIFVANGRAVITANTMISNYATWGGGGIKIDNGNVNLYGNRIADNQASYGGGIEIENGEIYAAANEVLDNQASSAWLLSVSDVHLVAVNNVVAGSNQVGLDVMGSITVHVELIHNTFADNGAEGLKIGGTSILTLVNNIVASNTIGIGAYGGCVVSATHTLFYGNPSGNVVGAGTVDSANEIIGSAPQFVDPAEGDYHLTAGSPGVNQGTTTAVTVDIDGDRRPVGTLPDVGADEVCIPVYLPLVTRD